MSAQERLAAAASSAGDQGRAARARRRRPPLPALYHVLLASLARQQLGLPHAVASPPPRADAVGRHREAPSGGGGEGDAARSEWRASRATRLYTRAGPRFGGASRLRPTPTSSCALVLPAARARRAHKPHLGGARSAPSRRRPQLTNERADAPRRRLRGAAQRPPKRGRTAGANPETPAEHDGGGGGGRFAAAKGRARRGRDAGDRGDAAQRVAPRHAEIDARG